MLSVTTIADAVAIILLAVTTTAVTIMITMTLTIYTMGQTYMDNPEPLVTHSNAHP